MKLTEREETTQYAIKIIDSCFKRNEYTSALLLSFIYASIRLSTILTNYLSPNDDKWKETHKILNKINFSVLIKQCKDKNILSKDDYNKLDKLRILRNNIAHESILWKELSEDEIKNIKEKCESVKNFLQITNN
jgi:hypothetical protein